jgi:septal ring factor EnvC (AmiA/AmiB activator)
MRSFFILTIIFGLVLAGCNDRSDEVTQLSSDLQQAKNDLAQRDKYIDEITRSLNEVYMTLENVRAAEGQLQSHAENVEAGIQRTSQEARDQVFKQVAAVETQLRAGREKIALLEKRVKNYKSKFNGLNKMVASLKVQLQERETAIGELQARLTSLEAEVTRKNATIAVNEMAIASKEKSLNTVYYIVGTRDELREKGVITEEGGFLWGLLGSSTVLAEEVDEGLFTPIDKSNETVIPISRTIKDVIPRRNVQSYAKAETAENQADLQITDPLRFWRQRYAVIIVE